MTTQHHINTAVSAANSERARRVAIRYLVRNGAHDPAAHAALNSLTDPLGLSLRREARNRHWASEMEIRPGDMDQIEDDDGESAIATIAKGAQDHVAGHPRSADPRRHHRDAHSAGVANACADQWGRHALSEMEPAQ